MVCTWRGYAGWDSNVPSNRWGSWFIGRVAWYDGTVLARCWCSDKVCLVNGIICSLAGLDNGSLVWGIEVILGNILGNQSFIQDMEFGGYM